MIFVKLKMYNSYKPILINGKNWYENFTTPKFHIFLAILHIFTGFYMLSLVENKSGNFQLYEIILRDKSVTLEDSYNVNILDFVVIFEIFTSICHIYYGWYFHYFKNDISFESRMYEYFISASIMIVIISILSGIREINSLFLLVILMSTIMLIGKKHEQIWLWGILRKKTLLEGISVLGWFPFLGVWFLIMVVFFKTISNSSKNPPNFVYSIIFILFIFYSLFGANQLYLLRNSYSEDIRIKYDATNNLLSLFSKLILSWLLFFGIKSQS